MMPDAQGNKLPGEFALVPEPDLRLDPNIILPEERIMQGASIKTEWALGNLFFRKIDLKPKGMICPGHEHEFDHATIVGVGGVLIQREWPNGERDQIELWAGELPVLIDKNCKHTIVSLVFGTIVFCMYSHRKPQADGTTVVTQEYTGWEKAHASK